MKTEGRTKTTVISCRRSNRVYLVTDQIKVTKPRRQYYTDDWRWQEGLKCFDENKSENCNMLQKSLVKVARGDKKVPCKS